MFTYATKIEKVIDGDTVDCIIDLGFNIYHKERFRLNGIDTAEKTSSDPVTKQKGLDATKFLKDLIEGKDVKIVTYKPDKYGRYLCDIYTLSDDKKTVNTMLLENGLAKVYDGGSKQGLWESK